MSDSARSWSDELFESAPDGILVVGADGLIRQVIGNLLSNAIKFTAAGGRATLRAHREASQIRIEVEDTGRGFPPHQAETLFEPFYQVEPGRDPKGGLGLGLAVARQLVLLHRGTLTACSEGPGRGARFVLCLPSMSEVGEAAPRQAAPPAPARAPHPLRGRHVLVVDDDHLVRQGMTQILEMAGATVEGADSVAAAWERLTARAPDLLISDLRMPGEDGLVLVRRLRQSPVPSLRSLPAVALTGRASSDDRQRALGAGFDAFLAKPVNVTDLIATACQVLENRT